MKVTARIAEWRDSVPNSGESIERPLRHLTGNLHSVVNRRKNDGEKKGGGFSSAMCDYTVSGMREMPCVAARIRDQEC